MASCFIHNGLLKHHDCLVEGALMLSRPLSKDELDPLILSADIIGLCHQTGFQVVPRIAPIGSCVLGLHSTN